MIPYILIFRNRDIYSKRKDMCYLLQGGHMTILNINTMIILHPEYQKKHLINVCQFNWVCTISYFPVEWFSFLRKILSGRRLRDNFQTFENVLLNTFFILGACFCWDVTGTQPGIFWGRVGFLEQGHFDKCFMCNTQKKGAAGKNLGVFSPRCF